MAGFSWGTALGTVAAEFPDTNFVVIDAVVDQPNVQSIIFDEHTGSFLVGAIAALKSQTGTVGFVGGMDVPIIHKFYCGYAQGAKAANPDVKLIENYTGTTPAAWNDPVTAGELTKAQFDAGADVVFAAAGGSGLGVLQAAADAGKFAHRRRQQPELPASGFGADLDAEARRRRREHRAEGSRRRRHLQAGRDGARPRGRGRRLRTRRQQRAR